METTQVINSQPLNRTSVNGKRLAAAGWNMPTFLLWITIIKIWALVGFIVYLWGQFLREPTGVLQTVLYPDLFLTTNLIPIGIYFILIALSIYWTLTADARAWGIMLFFCVSEILSCLIGIWLFPPFYDFLQSIGHAWAGYSMTDLMSALFIPLIVVDLFFIGYYLSDGVMRYFKVEQQSRLAALVVLLVVALVVHGGILLLSESVFGLDMLREGYRGNAFDYRTLIHFKQ